MTMSGLNCATNAATGGIISNGKITSEKKNMINAKNNPNNNDVCRWEIIYPNNMPQRM